MTTLPRPGPPAAEPLLAWTDVLRRLSAEARSLASLTARIEQALAEAAGSPCGTGEVSTEVQELDRLRQTLEDMGRLLWALSAQAPDAPLDPAPLSTTLTLRALADRLLHGDGRPGFGDGAESGTLTIL